MNRGVIEASGGLGYFFFSTNPIEKDEERKKRKHETDYFTSEE